MKRHVAWTLTLVAGAWAAASASGQMLNPPTTQQKKAAAPAAKPTVDPAVLKAQQEAELRAIQAMTPILAEWEKRSAKVVSLDAVFDKIDRSPFGDQWFRGRAMLQSPDKACLQFTKYILDKDHKPIVDVDKDGKKKARLEELPTERIVCTGTQVLQYSWDSKAVIVHPLEQQARLKALQEGPLPFLFNMKATEARQRYTMKLYTEFENEYVIDIMPRERIDVDSFAVARLWLNKATFLPNQLWLVKVGGKEREEYKFNAPNDQILANGPMDQKYFGFQKFDKWKVVVNQGDGKPGAAPGAGQAPQNQQVAQPGTRPSGR